MNKSIVVLVSMVASFALNSCTKCNECTDCPFGVENTICRDGFDSNADYQDAVDNAENAGCDCTATVK